jgi:hypothetical protein
LRIAPSPLRGQRRRSSRERQSDANGNPIEGSEEGATKVQLLTISLSTPPSALVHHTRPKLIKRAPGPRRLLLSKSNRVKPLPEAPYVASETAGCRSFAQLRLTMLAK